MSDTVRFAMENDIPAIMELLKQVNRVHQEGRPDLFKLATKYTEKELSDILKNDKTPVFVYEDTDGKILGHGFCVLQHPENTNLLHDLLTLYIDDICVDEAARGRNVGRKIYEHIVSYARRCGCYNVTLNVWSCNPGAMKFYESLGLLPYKIGMEKILNGDNEA
ncbi:MAG: GNAT family N-acetyltransferase [Lachnospiraceae bacterium]|nr:GNAT family N-acetyltransferase [Lachnospiraceae bacterium]